MKVEVNLQVVRSRGNLNWGYLFDTTGLVWRLLSSAGYLAMGIYIGYRL